MKWSKLNILRGLSILSLLFFAYAIFFNIRYGIWRDEGFTALLIQKSPREILHIMTQDNNPPLQPFLSYISSKVFGFNEFGLRFFSLVAVVVCGFFLRKIVSNAYRKEIITILFFTSFQSIYYATEGRPYGLFMALTLLTFWATLKLYNNFNLKNLALLGTLSVLLMYSQTLGLLVFLTNGVIFLIKNSHNKKYDSKIILQYFVGNALAFLTYIPWIYVIIKQFQNVQDKGFWLTFHPFNSLKDNFFGYYSPGISSIANTHILTLVGLAILVLTFFLGIWHSIRQKRYNTLIAYAVPMVLVYLLSFKQPLYYIRYIIFLMPFVFLLNARGFTKISKNLQIAAISIVFLFNVATYADLYNADHKSAFHAVERNLSKADKIEYKFINDQEYSFFECQFYIQNCLLLKEYDSINKSIGLSLITKEMVINDSQILSYNQIAIISYSSVRPQNQTILESYKFVKELQIREKKHSINIYFYEKI